MNKIIIIGNLGKDPEMRLAVANPRPGGHGRLGAGGAIHSLEERFWLGVDVRGPDECWPWQRCKDRYGYGKIATKHGKAPLRVPRLAYEIQCAPLPPGAQVLHHCDNPSCVNGRHLFLGDAKANLQDCSQKGRLNPKSLLNLRRGPVKKEHSCE